VLGIGDDPAIALVRHRHKVKEQDPVLGAELRVIVNALVFGIFGRHDETDRARTSGAARAVELPSDRKFRHCRRQVLLAVVNRLVADAANRRLSDTDSSSFSPHPKAATSPY